MKISVIGIEGAKCGVDAVGEAATTTGGGLHLVNPLELQRQMRFIIDNPPIGLKVNVKLLASKAIAFTPYYGMAAKAKELKNSFIEVLI